MERYDPDHESNQDQESGLCNCPECSSNLVYPTAWEDAQEKEEGTDAWEVDLRCPNCEWTDTGKYSQDRVDKFDDELARGTEMVADELRRLTQANMSDEIDVFAKGLEVGAILPEDF